MVEAGWEPPATVEERLRRWLVPPRLRLKYLLARERARGEAEIGLVPFLADPAKNALDIGANKGVWAEALRRHARHVHAFEPNPKIFRELRRGAHRDVSLHAIALSDVSGEAELRVPRGRKGYSNQGASLSRLKVDDGSAYGSLMVETRRLDDLDLGPIGFIKIDVEGHEAAVIAGARRTLAEHRPNLIVEIEERHIKAPIEGALAAICALGYECFALDGGLRRAARIDLEARHRHCQSRADYIFNWVFLPS